MSSPRYWREIPQRYRLEAGKCTQCGKLHYPPRQVCSACGSQAFETMVLANEGTLETYTIIHVAPSPFADQAPYAVGIIRMKDGVKMLTQVVDCEADELHIGMALKLEFRRISEEGEAGIICYGHKAVPI